MRRTGDGPRRAVRRLSDVGCWVRVRGRRYSTLVQWMSVGRQAHSSATSRSLNAAPTAYARGKIHTSKIVGLLVCGLALSGWSVWSVRLAL